jgi:hypothetical protein
MHQQQRILFWLVGGSAGGVGKAALPGCCVVVGVPALAALLILASKPKKCVDLHPELN